MRGAVQAEPVRDLHLQLVLRILVGTVLGGVIGYERDLRRRTAGLRTHALVALASATFMVVSTHFAYFQRYGAPDLSSVDGSRIAASVVSGIGFLAGGAILRTGITIQGLTTAAGLWLVSAIGLAAGGGMYVESIVATVIGVGALTLMRRFEDRNGLITRLRVSVVLDHRAPPIAVLQKRLADLGAQISQEDYEKEVDEKKARVAFDLRVPSALNTDVLISSLESEAGVRRIRLERLS